MVIGSVFAAVACAVAQRVRGRQRQLRLAGAAWADDCYEAVARRQRSQLLSVVVAAEEGVRSARKVGLGGKRLRRHRRRMRIGRRRIMILPRRRSPARRDPAIRLC
jgi:hypothetical protein